MSEGFLTEKPLMVIHEWLRERIKLPWSEDFRAFARVVDGKIVGCVGYTEFTGTACTIHVAGEGDWITAEMAKIAFKFPFDDLGLKMVFGKLNSSNELAGRFYRLLGFKELIRIEGVYPDGDLVLLQLKKEDWSKHGRQST